LTDTFKLKLFSSKITRKSVTLSAEISLRPYGIAHRNPDIHYRALCKLCLQPDL